MNASELLPGFMMGRNGIGDVGADDGDDEALRSVIEARMRNQSARLLTLNQERQRIDAEVERVQQHLAHLTPIARDLGLEPQPVQEQERVLFAPGNRSGRMPMRRAAYTAMSLPDAVASILVDGRERHADELVDLIFDEHSTAQHKAAKGSLAPALFDGVKRGRWRRSGPNRFRVITGGEAQSMT